MFELIVNADDFGLNQKVNNEILVSFQSGILRSVSLMANGKSFEHAVQIIRANPDLDTGIHLTLTEEKPVFSSENLHTIVDQKGNLHGDAINFTKAYFLGRISFVEVRNELLAQFEKILDYGINISHIDSHQHLHVLPRILEIVIELADKYKIKFIRFPMERFSKYMFKDVNQLGRVVQMLSLNLACSLVRNKIHVTTDYFFGFYFGGKLDKKNLINLINKLPSHGIGELMCHPGLIENGITNRQSNYRRVEESMALIDYDIAEIIKKKNIEITSFNKLI